MWLLEREKTLNSVLQRAKQYTIEALQWMIDDGVAAKIDVNVERQTKNNTDILAIQPIIYRVSGSKIALQYSLQWTAQGLR